MGITVDAAVSGQTASGGTSFTISRGTVAAGDVVVVGAIGGAAAVSSVTDSIGGNTYTNPSGAASVAWANVSIWVGVIVTGGTCTLTVNLASSTHGAGQAYIVHGLTGSPVDQTANAASASGGSSTPSVTTGSTTSANEVVIGACGVFLGSGTVAMTAGSGYTATNNNSTPTSGQTVSLATEYKIVSSVGAQTVNGTLGFSTLWDLAAVTLVGAPDVAPQPIVMPRPAVVRASSW